MTKFEVTFIVEGKRHKKDIEAADFYSKDGLIVFIKSRDPNTGFGEKVAAFNYGTVLSIVA